MDCKNQYFRYLLLSILFILLNNADCSRSKNEPTSYLSDEFKSYVIFNEGSSWVYGNQFNDKDTVILISIEHSFIDLPYTYPVERYNFTTTSTINEEKKYLAQCIEGQGIGCSNFSVLSTNYFNPKLFFCCCDEGFNYENLQFVNQLDSLEINDEMYFDVKIFKSDSIDSQSLSTLYYAKNIGLIQYEDFNSIVWKLLNHNLLQDL
jgi:hypothetical protein